MELFGSIITTLVVIGVVAGAALHKFGPTIRAIWSTITGREPR